MNEHTFRRLLRDMTFGWRDRAILTCFLGLAALAANPAGAAWDDGLFQTRTVPQDRSRYSEQQPRREIMRPVYRSQTALIAFKSSPFPYSGVFPSTGKPFFDVEEDGRKGHTTQRGKVYWEDETYKDRRVLLYIPRGFDPNLPAALIVYFHGNGARLDRDVRNRQQVPQQVAESGINAVLVAPQFAVDALDSSAGRFWEPGAFAQFLDEASDHLAKMYGVRSSKTLFRSMPLIFVAYSGGYFPAAYAAAVGGVSKQLLGVVLFDALYAEHAKFQDFILKHKDGFFLSAYGPSTKEANETMQSMLTDKGIPFQIGVQPKLASGTVTFLSVGPEIEHNDFVTKAWTARPLAQVLSSIRTFSRVANNRRKQDRDEQYRR